MIEESAPLARPRTLTAQRGFDKARYIRDHLLQVIGTGQRVDTIMVSPATMGEMQRAWLEMAPENTPMPQDMYGAKIIEGDTGGSDYAFLRDWLPWEKRAMLAEGHNDAYREGAKAPVATGERR